MVENGKGKLLDILVSFDYNTNMSAKSWTFTRMMKMDKNTHYILLFDCYQALLTDKQRQMMELYYNHDFTLVEIAEELQISRQGVYDHIKRTVQLLQQYEDKMGLLATFRRQNRVIQRMKNSVATLELQFAEKAGMESSAIQLKALKESLEQLYQISTS